MDPPGPGKERALDVNNASHLTTALANTTSATLQQPNAPTSTVPAWSAQMNSFSVNSNGGSGSSFPQFSASTAAILERLQQGKSGHASTSAAFEAKKAEIMQNYATSDKLPTPPPAPTVSKRGKGTKAATPLKTEVGATGMGAAPTSGRGLARGKGRGRWRGRGGRGGRGSKRKRSDSEDEESDVSVDGVLLVAGLTVYRMTTTTLMRQNRTHHKPHGPSLGVVLTSPPHSFR